MEGLLRRPGGGAGALRVPTGVTAKGRGCKPAVCCVRLLSHYGAGDRTQGVLTAHSTTEVQPQHPARRGLCASDSCIKRAVVGLEGLLPMSPALTSRAPVPYEATTSSFLLGLPCGISSQAEERHCPLPKCLEEDVSSWEGKRVGPLRSQNQARAQEIQRSQKSKDLLGLPHRTPWQKFSTTMVASTLT